MANPAPWMREAAERILQYSDATNADLDKDDVENIADIIARHAPSEDKDLRRAIEIGHKHYIQNAEQAQSVLWILEMLSREYDDLKKLRSSPSEEQVRELVQAAREMCCWVGHETFPHSFNADISRLHRALEPFKEVSRG